MATSFSDYPIAVVGAGCRLPGKVQSLADLWRLLAEEQYAVREVPPDRWTQAELAELPAQVLARMRHGGFLDGDVYAFDAAAFGMNEHEARFADPQHRLLWEVVWEALEHAGMPPMGLAGARVGQYFGSYAKDYLLRTQRGPTDCDPYTFFTALDSVVTGRLGFLLDVRGPALPVEGACASSLMAVHAACQALRAGEVEVALAGGTQLALGPELVASFARWEGYSPTGQSRPFDAQADGFVRAEGCGVVVLKRLAEALRAGDRVLAVLRGSAVNVNGMGTRLTAPSAAAQVEVYRTALACAGVDPGDVGMVEAHGPGTPAGDPVEFASVAEVYGAGRGRCALGSVKSNIGHAEAASGMAGLLKAIAAVRHGAVPATLHFTRWNPLMDPDGTRLFVPTAMVPWPVAGAGRLAAVSSFGATGSNGHVIVEAPPQRTAPVSRRRAPADAPARSGAAGGADSEVRAFLLSGRTYGAVRESAGRLALWLEADGANALLADVAHTLAVRRSHSVYRAAVTAGGRAQLLARLRAVHEGRPVDGVAHGEQVPGAGERGPVWVFAGHGSQWAGMCRGLLDTDAAFTAAIDELEPLVAAESGFSLRTTLTARQVVTGFDRVQPTLFAVQMGLAAMWRSWGVEPAAIIGYSMGEAAAAVTAGALSVADGVGVICRRSRLILRTAGQGLMASVALGHREVEERLARENVVGVSVAVITAPHLTVIGGDAAQVRALAARWEAQGIGIRLVNVDVASHTGHMDALKTALTQELAGLQPSPARVPFYTTALDDPREAAGFDAAYWFANQRRPVQFAQAVRAAWDDGYRLFVELGPHPLLSGAIPASAGGPVAAVASLLRDSDERSAFLAQLAAFHTAGGNVDWARHYGDGRLVDAPATTWERQHLSVPPSRPRAAAGVAGHPLVGPHVADPDTDGRHLWQARLDPQQVPWLADHTFNGAPVLFATAYAEMCVQAALDLFGGAPGHVRVTDLHIHRALAVARPVTVTAHATLARPGRAEWAVETGNAQDGRTHHATARLEHLDLSAPAWQDAPEQPDLDALRAAHRHAIDTGAFYTDVRETLGVHYGPAFQGLRSLRAHDGPDGTSVLASYSLPDAARPASRHLHCHPVILDTAGQAAVAAWRHATETAEGGIVVTRIGCLRLYGELPATGWLHARTHQAGPRSARATVRILSPGGVVAAELAGIELTSVPTRRPDEHLQTRLLGLDWSETPLPAVPADTTGRWLLVHTGNGRPFAETLAAALSASGTRAGLAPADDTPALRPPPGDDHHRVTGVVFVPGTAGADDGDQAIALAQEHVIRLVHLAQVLTAGDDGGGPVRLWALTRNAETTAAGEMPNLAQAGLRGALRTLGYEHPRLTPTLLDTDAHTSPNRLARELLTCPATEDHIAYRNGRRLLACLRPAPLTAGDRRRRTADFTRERADLAARTPGDLDSLELIAVPRRPPGPRDVEIRVHATGLNFSHVLTTAGHYARPGQDPQLQTAFDCAGTISAVGCEVTHLREGERVAAFAAAPYLGSSYVTVRADWPVLPVPDAMSLTDAACLPIAYLTAWHGLRNLARLQAGQRVLIHCASGGMGLAAVNVARLCGAEIWATAGTEAKRTYLRGQGIGQVLDSRTLDFADHLRQATNGHGIDVVWNCLAGPAQAASLDLLVPGGRFIEIGKKDVYDGTRLSLVPFGRNLSFHTLYLTRDWPQHPELTRTATEVTQALAQGLLPPLPVTAHPVTDAADAYRTLAQGRHTGRLALTWPAHGSAELPVRPQDVPLVRDDGSYLITGGLGGLGLLAARWLTDHYAGTVILTSRDAPDPHTGQHIEELRQRGTRIEVVLGDIAAPGTAERLVQAATATGHRLAGVLHAAAVIEDATTETLTDDLIRRVWHPKTTGTWRLHQATATHDLDWWVAYSSAASTLGNGGQTAYAAANAWLEEFTSWRRAQGLPATCIAWGPWADVGAGAFMQARGYEMIAPEEGMAALRHLLAHGRPRTTYTPADYHRWLQAHPTADRLAYFAPLLGTTAHATDTGPNLSTALARCTTQAERHHLLQQAVITHTATVLHHDPAALTPATAFNAIGLDSLMSTSLRNKLEHDTGLRIPPSVMWAQHNPADLTHYLLEQLPTPAHQCTAPNGNTHTSAAGTPPPPNASAPTTGPTGTGLRPGAGSPSR
ncbi:type I polyketide synthase [Streptomyces sp. MST-110588]|uniref:type I polyketide synthase n=1 Tax=Streptomyces sp. MST-110588 TaxID=2833628 RepID=UPI001F5E2072|nr:type I polyketide synthase [Streptomyces sp. MST-110588]UNO42988.1 type I polyketide synthase [Streptomyces sp. MST-110588]